MGILWILVPLALLLSATAGGAYWWAWRNRQFEDMETPALRVLFEDTKPGNSLLVDEEKHERMRNHDC